MDKQIVLTQEEQKELQNGRALYEMTQTAGWKIVEQMFTDAMVHTWVDPRTIEGPEAEKEWKWKELQAFFAANQAKEVLEAITKIINQGQYMEAKQRGEIAQAKAMRI
jgi:hypothetical protein